MKIMFLIWMLSVDIKTPGPQNNHVVFVPYWLKIHFQAVFWVVRLSIFPTFCSTVSLIWKITLQMALKLGSLLAWSNTRRRMRSQPTKRWPRSWKIPWSRMDLKGFKWSKRNVIHSLKTRSSPQKGTTSIGNTPSGHPFSGAMSVSFREGKGRGILSYFFFSCQLFWLIFKAHGEMMISW